MFARLAFSFAKIAASLAKPAFSLARLAALLAAKVAPSARVALPSSTSTASLPSDMVNSNSSNRASASAVCLIASLSSVRLLSPDRLLHC